MEEIDGRVWSERPGAGCGEARQGLAGTEDGAGGGDPEPNCPSPGLASEGPDPAGGFLKTGA